MSLISNPSITTQLMSLSIAVKDRDEYVVNQIVGYNISDPTDTNWRDGQVMMRLTTHGNLSPTSKMLRVSTNTA